MTGQVSKRWLFGILVGLTVLLIVGIAGLPAILQVFWGTLTATTRLIFDLIGIGLIAIILLIFLMPLEALGWWAGWYGDPVETTSQNLGRFQESLLERPTISRYVVYLDGIGQSTFDYLPEVEQFLDELAEDLPDNIQIIRGLMPYSPMNRSLTSPDRFMARFWSFVNRLKAEGKAGFFSFLINLRNIFAVWVSADQRYGPIYNRGTAQVIYNSLIQQGYVPGSGIPVTLLGFSGGGQISMGAAPYLKEAIFAPLDVVSIAGVFSGNNESLKLEHIYHLVGEKDFVERVGPIFFPKRWAFFVLSYWNRTKRLGKVSVLNLGPVGHQVPGGVMDAEYPMPNGQTALQQTVEQVSNILQGRASLQDLATPRVQSNFARYQEAPFNRPEFYPITTRYPSDRYRPVANWIGRLILPDPDQRQSQAIPFEVHHAPPENADLIGQVVTLGWSENPHVQRYVQQVVKDLHFSPDAEYRSRQGGVYPTRLNHWRLVDPLESLAGSHPNDDMIVALPDPVSVERHADSIQLAIASEPIQITGRYYGLVKFIAPVDPTDSPERFRVVHFNKTSGQFDGMEETVWLPTVVPDDNDTLPFTNSGIERSPLNERGWYIYGASDQSGTFVVQAIAPRSLFQIQPIDAIVGRKAVKTYLKKTSWDNLAQQKGHISAVQLSHRSAALDTAHWTEGTRALLVHVYGGIGGNKTEPAAQGPIYFGHFAFGIATVIRDPFTDELRFEIVYHQIYTHNPDGLIAGTLHWSRYMGDRQFGWMGTRPIADTLIQFDPFTGDYPVTEKQERSPLDVLIRQLEVMAARYRIGDGSGGTYVGPANNCAQDSNQSLYAALRQMERSIQEAASTEALAAWMKANPEQAQRLQQLQHLGDNLQQHLMPLGSARADWASEAKVLGSSLEDDPLKTLGRGLISWRTLLPRVANDGVIQCFLRQGATAWMLRTNQLGGDNPDIEPLAPITF